MCRDSDCGPVHAKMAASLGYRWVVRAPAHWFRLLRLRGCIAGWVASWMEGKRSRVGQRWSSCESSGGSGTKTLWMRGGLLVSGPWARQEVSETQARLTVGATGIDSSGYITRQSWPGGGDGGGPRAPCRPRAIWSGSVTTAETRSRPLQRQHCMTSMEKTRASNFAHPMRAGRSGLRWPVVSGRRWPATLNRGS